MNISLTPQLKAFVDEQVRSGRFESPSDAVCDALRLLERKDQLGAVSGLEGPSFKNLGGPGDGDIMALCFIVLMEAAKSAQEDLKDIMAGVKAINAAKAQQRDVIRKVRADVVANAGHRDDTPLKFSPGGLGSEEAYHRAELPHADPDAQGGVRLVATDLHRGKISDARELCAILEDLKGRLDSMSELGEMESLRLQMAMDRRSKLISTLSNVMKKSSDAASTIVENLK